MIVSALALVSSGCGAAQVTQPAAEAQASRSAPMPSPEPEQPLPVPTPEPTPEPEAVQLPLSFGPKAYQTALLQDGTYYSSASFEAGEEMTVTAEQPIGALYLIWNSRPAEWTLRTEHGETVCGTQGVFHELVILPVPVSELTMVMPAAGESKLGDVYGFTAGTLPDWVQRWEPPCERADLLLISSHADDEFIFFGGVLPTYAGERALEVQVAYMVDHFESHWYRWHELLNGLWTAGVTHYPVTGGFPDGRFSFLWEAEAFYGEKKVLEWQVGLLRRFQPLTVVAHAETGEYGNNTHKLNCFCAERAVELAADPLQFPQSAEAFGTWNTPKLYVHLYGESPTVLDFEHPIERFGGASAFEVAEDALRKHLSQQRSYRVYGSEYPQYDCHVYGLYRSLVGEDKAKNDLMEHIVVADWRKTDKGAPL